MEKKNYEDIYQNIFPFWNELSADDKEYICLNSTARTYLKGTTIHDSSECSGVFLVKSGCLRLYMMSDDGKDITLYRMHEGDLCILSASCVLRTITFDVFIDAEETSKCYLISGPAFASLAEKNTNIKIYTLETALSRFSDVMWVMQQILFMSIDKRLAIFLLDESARIGSDTILLTHEQIARYMGSAREVVSRMLKYFSSENIVEVSRKGVKILDKKRLHQLAL
ncbi:MAG: Crp/Fnr family transcriptional regulator [Ruminococcaceae bacterium]|nr:Crp/Fnr family transcriptional regulator [Oscillospiraceae bacterium]